jgi:hypothetical protein
MIFKLVEEKDIIVRFKEYGFFVISTVINVIVGVGINFHGTNLRSFVNFVN